jgi:hypothetical protein
MYEAALTIGSPKVVVSYERLTTDTGGELLRIARKLSLNYDSSWFRTWFKLEDLHRVAGNGRPFQLIKDKGAWIQPDDSWKELLTERDVERVKALWKPYRGLIERMEKLSC